MIIIKKYDKMLLNQNLRKEIKMKNQKKFIALIIVTVLFLSSTGSVFADVL